MRRCFVPTNDTTQEPKTTRPASSESAVPDPKVEPPPYQYVTEGYKPKDLEKRGG